MRRIILALLSLNSSGVCGDDGAELWAVGD